MMVMYFRLHYDGYVLLLTLGWLYVFVFITMVMYFCLHYDGYVISLNIMTVMYFYLHDGYILLSTL